MVKEKQMSVGDFFDSFTISSEYTYYIFFTNSFKKDVKKCFKRNLDLKILADIVNPHCSSHPLNPIKKLKTH